MGWAQGSQHNEAEARGQPVSASTSVGGGIMGNSMENRSVRQAGDVLLLGQVGTGGLVCQTGGCGRTPHDGEAQKGSNCMF